MPEGDVMKKVRKGFTLVELLIVIVIIGILAAAMLLSSGSASASAEASNIISGMRSLKSSVIVFIANYKDFFDVSATAPGPGTVFSQAAAPVLVPSDPESRSVWQILQSHMDNPAHLARYAVVIGPDNTWWVRYTFPSGAVDSTEIQRKLQPRASAMGLYAGMINKTAVTTTQGDYTAGNADVYMIAF